MQLIGQLFLCCQAVSRAKGPGASSWIGICYPNKYYHIHARATRWLGSDDPHHPNRLRASRKIARGRSVSRSPIRPANESRMARPQGSGIFRGALNSPEQCDPSLNISQSFQSSVIAIVYERVCYSLGMG